MAKSSDIYTPPPAPKTPSTPQVTAPLAPTNTLVLVGFILSLASIVVGITAIPGVILGHLGLKQIKTTGESGRGLGITALAVGYSVIGLSVLAVIIVSLVLLVPLIIIAVAAMGGGYY